MPVHRLVRRLRPLRRPALALLATGLTTGLTTGLAVGVAGPASAAPSADYEMPFPCAQQWTGSTRSNHSPSSRAVDWNRPDDVGDPVVASAPGTVIDAYAKINGGYGRWVRVDHGNSETTIYAHLNKVTVADGQWVDQGTLLGYVGSTGNSSGPHLHYEQRQGRDVQPAWFHRTAFAYGSTETSRNCLDSPIAGNMMYDARSEVMVYRRTARSEFLVKRWKKDPMRLRMGGPLDDPFVGDWDGDGRLNPGVRSPGSRQFRMRTPKGLTRLTWGESTDRPIAGDWNGDGTWEVGLQRPASATFLLRAADGTVSSFALGGGDDVPVTGDWNGDGRTDVGVYDLEAARFTLRYVDKGGTAWTASVRWGRPGDMPVAGDWDGNGITDVGVWRPETARFLKRRSVRPTAARATTGSVWFGRRR